MTFCRGNAVLVKMYLPSLEVFYGLQTTNQDGDYFVLFPLSCLIGYNSDALTAIDIPRTCIQ